MRTFCLIAATAATIAATATPALAQQLSDIGSEAARAASTAPSPVIEYPPCQNRSEPMIAAAGEEVKTPAPANQMAPRGNQVVRAPESDLGTGSGGQDQGNEDSNRKGGASDALDNNTCETEAAECCPQADTQCPANSEDACASKQQTDTDYTPRLRDKYRPG